MHLAKLTMGRVKKPKMVDERSLQVIRYSVAAILVNETDALSYNALKAADAIMREFVVLPKPKEQK